MLADGGCWCARAAQMYVPWNWHAPQPGEYMWSGGRNITRFLDIAQELGLNVVLRPGPYVCAEVRRIGNVAETQGLQYNTLVLCNMRHARYGDDYRDGHPVLACMDRCLSNAANMLQRHCRAANTTCRFPC